jgi:radical SAM-linked protein
MTAVSEPLPRETEPRSLRSDDAERPDAATLPSAAALPSAGVEEQCAATDPPAEQPLRVRYRVRFAKTQLLRWISHRDLARLWERLVRRAALNLSMTEGFHPKPRIAFPSALALGVEGLDEVVELELAEEMAVEDLHERLRIYDQPGLTINSVARLPDQFGKAQLAQSDYLITVIETADRDSICRAIARLMSQPTVSVERKSKTLTVEVASQIATLEVAGDELRLSLFASDQATLRPVDVLGLLGFGDWIEQGALITRVRVQLSREFEPQDSTQIAIATRRHDAWKGKESET